MLLLLLLLLRAGISPTHGLFATAGEDGQLECWDVRARNAVAAIDAAAAAGAPGKEAAVCEGVGRTGWCATADSASQVHRTPESTTPGFIASPAPTLAHTSPLWSSHSQILLYLLAIQLFAHTHTARVWDSFSIPACLS